MRKALLAITALAAVTMLGERPSQAYYGDAPWCAVQAIGPAVTERCVFRDFESCRQEVIAGNRGFCNENRYRAGYLASPPKPRLSRKRMRH